MNKKFTIPKKNSNKVGRSGHEDKIKIQNDNDMDVDVTLFDDDPQNVTHPQGKTITWLAHFKVHGQVKYTIHVSGISNFVFWDGAQLQTGQNWTTREMTGDPAIGRD
jgi:hypothetical protein